MEYVIIFLGMLVSALAGSYVGMCIEKNKREQAERALYTHGDATNNSPVQQTEAEPKEKISPETPVVEVKSTVRHSANAADQESVKRNMQKQDGRYCVLKAKKPDSAQPVANTSADAITK